MAEPRISDELSDKNSPPSPLDEKTDLKAHGPADEEFTVLEDERDISTHIITVADDETLNPWTCRVIFMKTSVLGNGAGIDYVLGRNRFRPRKRVGEHHSQLGRLPHPFNKKEHAFIVIMASAAANSALATEVLAVQRLYYNITPNPGSSIFLLFASQLVGYGIGGLFRHALLYPSKMLYPVVLPLVSMFDALYKDTAGAGKKLRLFWIAFTGIFFWEILPEWMFPLLTGFSVFCLANPHSANFTRIFGGSNGNEGLGVLSICFDWQYISGGKQFDSFNPMTIPLKAQFSSFVGYILSIVVFCAVWYGNIWNAQSFPFLSQQLFYANGSQYDQLLILNADFEVDPTLLEEQGLPFYASTWVVMLLTTNLGMAATFTHLLLWNRNDLRATWSWMAPSALKESWANVSWKFWQDDGIREVPNDSDIDPHYREMLKYPDAPNSWYFLTLIISTIISLVIIYKADSTLPWWGFFISLILAAISIVFYVQWDLYTPSPGINLASSLMIGGFLHPGEPVANMFFVLFGFNSVIQAQRLLKDLKIAQYTKLPPRAAFTAQVSGTLFGAVLNFVLMNSIIDNQREILLSIEGTNIWSGQQPQQYNSQAIAWGGLSHQLFAINQRYQWVAWAYVIGLFVPIPFWLVHRLFPKLHGDCLYTPVICYYIGFLCVGINSSNMSYFIIAYLSQWWLRTRYPRWFAKYNYILAAGLDGGTQVMVFILSFAVQGASGNSHLFPQWWGANQNGNYDHCLVTRK
ncbi:OPT oligopeptide transporter protein-domain-containing protein [Mycena galericulata]|nr:OPT oligopeptide transporter protein-domain-containing protein [Mycena galericulata]